MRRACGEQDDAARVRKLNEALHVLVGKRSFYRHGRRGCAPDHGQKLVMNPAQTVRQFGSPRRGDRSLLDQSQTAAVVVDHPETRGDRAGVDTKDAHTSF